MTLDLLLSVAFLAGFFGSGHCLGMCGPIVVLMETAGESSGNFNGVLRRLTYNAGRMLFYVLLGATAGALGLVLTKITSVNIGLSALRILAGLIVIALGVNLLFDLPVLRFLERGGAVVWKRLSPLARHVLPVTTPPRALAAGFIWGALPCGLVYSAVAIAATSGSATGGALIMLAFWIGTLPALLLAGASARKVGSWVRHPVVRRLTGIVLIGIGIFALAMPYLGSSSGGHHQEHASESQTAASRMV